MSATFDCLQCGKHHKKKHSGKFCSNKCQHTYQCLQKIANGTASARTVKFYLVSTKNACETCGINSWNGLPLVLELEHRDGNSSNNHIDNVCLLCSNCHSQTPTFKGKNKGRGRHERMNRYRQGKSF